MKRIFIAIIALSLASPALAMQRRPVDQSTVPAPAGERDRMYADYNKFVVCLGDPRFSEVRGRGELIPMELALGTAGVAAYSNNAQFQTEAAIVRAEIAKVGAKYGC